MSNVNKTDKERKRRIKTIKGLLSNLRSSIVYTPRNESELADARDMLEYAHKVNDLPNIIQIRQYQVNQGEQYLALNEELDTLMDEVYGEPKSKKHR